MSTSYSPYRPLWPRRQRTLGNYPHKAHTFLIPAGTSCPLPRHINATRNVNCTGRGITRHATNEVPWGVSMCGLLQTMEQNLSYAKQKHFEISKWKFPPPPPPLPPLRIHMHPSTFNCHTQLSLDSTGRPGLTRRFLAAIWIETVLVHFLEWPAENSRQIVPWYWKNVVQMIWDFALEFLAAFH